MPGMPGKCAIMISKVLAELGHPAPTDDQLKDLVSKAVREIAAEDGIDPKFTYKLTQVARKP